MYERFTDDARRAMQAANQEAIRLGHDYIGVEHILLGILAQPGIVAEACESLGVPASRAALVVSGEREKPTSRNTQQAKMVIEYAIVASRERCHESIGTDHLMMGILKAAPPDLILAIESAGLRCDELENELARRNPPGASPPYPLETLVQRFHDYPEVHQLHQQVVHLQQQLEDAVARLDFTSAAQFRDEKVEVQRTLTALLVRLQSES